MRTPHVIGCQCEACLEGLTEQHPAGCLCSGCKERTAALEGTDLGGLLRKVGARIEKAVRAADAVKDVLTPRERELLAKFMRGRS